MPRKVTKSLQRVPNPDRKYNSVLVQRLINKSMLNGKKLVAERAVYTALEVAAKKLDSDNPLEVFEKALKNVSPNLRLNHAALVVRTIRSHSQFMVTASCTTHLAGLCSRLVLVVACHTHSDLHLRSLMHITKLVLLSKRRKTLTRWQKQTVPLHTLLARSPLECSHLYYPLHIAVGSFITYFLCAILAVWEYFHLI